MAQLLTAPLLLEAISEVTSETVHQASDMSRQETSALRKIYVGHLLARWGAGMWDFFVALFMAYMRPDSLILTAAYGLLESLCVACFGTFVGILIDKSSDLKVVELSVLTRNASVLISASAMMVLLMWSDAPPPAFLLLVACVNIFGSIRALAGLGCTILLERNWVVKISGQTPVLLVEMNSTMKRIDLACKLLAPVFVGALMSSVSILACVIGIAIWNLASVGFEWWFLYTAFADIPALQRDTSEEELLITKEKVSFIKGYFAYARQETVLAGAALALLYFTVLSFGSLMTAALQSKAVPAYAIGLARGVSACIGVMATFVYPRLHSRLQSLRTGLWSIWMQWVCLLACVASVWITDNMVSVMMLMGGVVASRMGLWMFDLAVTQLMQESVPEAERGLVGGVQNSLESLMAMLSFGLAILVPNTEEFGRLVLVSFASVTLAVILFTYYVYKVRGHLIHLYRIKLV